MKRHGGPAGPAPGGAKKSKGPEDDGTPKPAYSVIQATNPISALYEYCRKSKLRLSKGATTYTGNLLRERENCEPA